MSTKGQDVAVWRIATDTPSYTADDRSGAGARITGGRWNRPGIPVLYCSGSIALACLETVAHLELTGLPLNRYLVHVGIPADLWQARTIVQANENIGWDAEPAGKVSLDVGGHWCRICSSVVMEVPSVIVPEESNFLLNPEHPDMKRIALRKVRKWLFDARLARR
ncbi:hypothetical protein CR159_09390 [Pollutimonas subterranea]|uniref:RES domain-containing protein n=1 Tax=Pollutimonas subterranea TaxID=2045210 RepID=A0A2N4U5C4_9BURK|nr:RES family NAD+ phosphorylase [Pollutimonas subterranea]PLC50207.1 hypothetical protein CR159_09390 [Pollutimonas subterranea]